MPPDPILAELDGEPVQLWAVPMASGGEVVLHIRGEYRGLAVVLDIGEVRRLMYALGCGHVRALQLQPERILAHA